MIPKEVRKSLKLVPGQKLQVFEYEGRIELAPIRPIKEMRRFANGINTDVPRNDDRY